MWLQKSEAWFPKSAIGSEATKLGPDLHFTDSVRADSQKRHCSAAASFSKRIHSLMIKPKECPKGGGKEEGRGFSPPSTPVLQGSCPQQFLFQNPLGGARGCPSLGASTWSAGTRRGPPCAEEGRGGPPRPHPFFFSRFGLPSTVLLSLPLRLVAHLCFFFSFLFTHR